MSLSGRCGFGGTIINRSASFANGWLAFYFNFIKPTKLIIKNIGKIASEEIAIDKPLIMESPRLQAGEDVKSLQNCKEVGSNVQNEVYRAQPTGVKRGDTAYIMGRGEMVEFALCPWKWIHKPVDEDDSTAAMDFGSLMDCLLTSPREFDKRFAIMPSTYTSSKGETKEWTLRANTCKQWVADKKADGIIPLYPAVLENAQKAVKVVRENTEVMEILQVSKKQVYVKGEWKDEATGLVIPIRVLIDVLPPASHPKYGKWIIDLKTARNGDPSKWARVIDDAGYDVQAALYMDVYMAATGEERMDWVHVVQENTEPFHLITPLPEMTAEFIEWGRMKYRAALTYYCQCLAAQEWPSYRPAGRAGSVLQFIGPESLWSYRQSVGSGNPEVERTLASMAAAQEDKPNGEPENIDLNV